MPKKKSASGRDYKIDGKRLTWTPTPDEDGDPLPDVVLPLRLKWKLVRSLVGREQDVTVAVEFVSAVAPTQAEVLDEMDINDIMEMFTTWQAEYHSLQGASLGESSGSSS